MVGTRGKEADGKVVAGGKIAVEMERNPYVILCSCSSRHRNELMYLYIKFTDYQG